VGLIFYLFLFILLQPLRYPRSRQQLLAEPDLEQVKADYLINQAFRLWTNNPWLKEERVFTIQNGEQRFW